MLAQEETRLKKQGGHSINLIGQGAGKGLKVKAKNLRRNHLLKFHRVIRRNKRQENVTFVGKKDIFTKIV